MAIPRLTNETSTQIYNTDSSQLQNCCFATIVERYESFHKNHIGTKARDNGWGRGRDACYGMSKLQENHGQLQRLLKLMVRNVVHVDRWPHNTDSIQDTVQSILCHLSYTINS